MRKRMWPVAAVVVLLSVGGALAARAAGTTVSMVESPGVPANEWRFDPSDVTISAGSTVTWHNSGQQPHTVTADDGSFKSDYIAPGGTFQHTFATPGTYAYHCEPHPWMKAVVHVTGGATPTTAAATTPTTRSAASSTPSSTTTSTTAGATRIAAAASSSTPTTTPAAGEPSATIAGPAAAADTTTTTVASTGGAASAAPATDNTTTTTTTAAAAAQELAASSQGHTSGHKTDTPLVVLAGIVTLLLIALTLSLLAAKS